MLRGGESQKHSVEIRGHKPLGRAPITGASGAACPSLTPSEGGQMTLRSSQGSVPEAARITRSAPVSASPGLTLTGLKNIGNTCYTRPPAQSCSKSPERRGLVNLGNTCYMNAVLQALFHSSPLQRAVLRSRPGPHRPLLAALQHVFAYLALSERPVVRPEAFARAAQPPWFVQGRQQDSSDLLRFLLDFCMRKRIPSRRTVGQQPHITPVRTLPRAVRERTRQERPAAWCVAC